MPPNETAAARMGRNAIGAARLAQADRATRDSAMYICLRNTLTSSRFRKQLEKGADHNVGIEGNGLARRA